MRFTPEQLLTGDAHTLLGGEHGSQPSDIVLSDSALDEARSVLGLRSDAVARTLLSSLMSIPFISNSAGVTPTPVVNLREVSVQSDTAEIVPVGGGGVTLRTPPGVWPISDRYSLTFRDDGVVVTTTSGFSGKCRGEWVGTQAAGYLFVPADDALDILPVVGAISILPGNEIYGTMGILLPVRHVDLDRMALHVKASRPCAVLIADTPYADIYHSLPARDALAIITAAIINKARELNTQPT